jgi:type II secretory pathway component GspD/PulD (secretin)
VQQLYADLVQRLDVRRPQVQIECTIVTLDTSDSYSVGIDISRIGGFDAQTGLRLPRESCQ